LNGVERWGADVVEWCGGGQQVTRWVAKLAMTKECCEESAGRSRRKKFVRR
jgi:hypothetical protein